MISSRKVIGASLLMTFLALHGCKSDVADETQDDLAGTTPLQQPLSDLGAEKIVGFRFICLQPCKPGTINCNPCVGFQHVASAVETLNRVFQVVGVQAYAKSFEEYYAPDFAVLNKPQLLDWPQVRAQLKQMFPTMSAFEWDYTDSHTDRHWLIAASTVVGARDAPEEYVVFLPQNTGVDASRGTFPEVGRGLFVNNAGLDLAT